MQTAASSEATSQQQAAVMVMVHIWGLWCAEG